MNYLYLSKTGFLTKLLPRKILIIMRNIFLLTVLPIFQLFAMESYSQETKLSLNMIDATIKEVLEKLEESSEYYFLYNSKLIDDTKLITIDVNEEPIENILGIVFKGSGIDYLVLDKLIILSTKEYISSSKAGEQPTLIRGTVKNEQGEPMIGVTVFVKGSTHGVITDQSGKYEIEVSPRAEMLVFSYVGSRSQEVPINSRNRIDVIMQSEIIDLDEVVVIGYGAIKKRDLTGAIASVNPEDIERKTTLTVAGALQGVAAGVNIINRSGYAGAESDILIRGVTNFSNNAPLYVIDGMPTTATRDFNMNDIESIQILKDASAAAIYGSRAANGVIIITTKKGSEGPMKVDFSAKYGISSAPRLILCDTTEWLPLNIMAYENANRSLMEGTMNPEYNTDWQDAVLRQGSFQDYNLSFSGGGETGGYFISGNYLKNDGVVVGNSIEKFSIRVNSHGEKGLFSYGESMIISNTFVDEMQGNPWMEAARMLPIIPVYDDNNLSGYGYGSSKAVKYSLFLGPLKVVS
jgi:TonB-dependent starch-binding outer membrane protein SusC